MSEKNETNLDSIEALFVQSAHGLTTNNGSVTFHGLAHATLFFADRPQRVVGHLTSRKFVDQWGDGEDSFATIRRTRLFPSWRMATLSPKK